MEKKELDQRLVSFAKEIPSVNYLIIINKDGVIVSNIAKNIEEKRDPNYVSSIVRLLSAPASNIQTAMGTSCHLMTISMFTKIIIVQFNLQTHTVALIIDKAKWPLTIQNFQAQLNDIYLYLFQIRDNRKSHLSIITAIDEKTDEQILDEVKLKISKMEQVIGSFESGKFNHYEIQLDSQEPREVCSIIGNALKSFALNSIIIDSDDNIIYLKDPNSEKLGYIFMNYLRNIDSDYAKLYAGRLITSIYYYVDGEVFITAPLGQIEEKRVELVNQLSNWNIGLYEILSYNYTAIANSHQVLNSEIANEYIETINFLLSDVPTLQQEIESYLQAANIDKAILLMNRVVFLLQQSGQYSHSGDFLKWIAYTYFESRKIDDSIKYYNLAAKDYEKSGDYSNLGVNLTDLGSIYESSNNLGGAMQTYKKASKIFQDIEDHAQAQAIEQKLGEIKTKITNKIQKFVKLEPFEQKSIEQLSKDLEIDSQFLPQIMQELVSSNQIEGNFDVQNNIYYKKSQRSNFDRVSVPGGGSRVATTTSGNINYKNTAEIRNKLNQENQALDRDIVSIETKFTDRGISVMDFLKYQAKMQKRTLNKKKIQIFTEKLQFNDSQGNPNRCGLCFDEFKENDQFAKGPGGHGFHTKCLSKWIKTQDKCPICDQKLLPDIFIGGGDVATFTPSDETSKAKIEELESLVKTLKQSLGGDSNLFDKLIMERENKARIMRDINKKDRMIRELRSQLEFYKKRS